MRKLLVLVFALMFLATACGGGSDSKENKDTSTTNDSGVPDIDNILPDGGSTTSTTQAQQKSLCEKLDAMDTTGMQGLSPQRKSCALEIASFVDSMFSQQGIRVRFVVPIYQGSAPASFADYEQLGVGSNFTIAYDVVILQFNANSATNFLNAIATLAKATTIFNGGLGADRVAVRVHGTSIADVYADIKKLKELPETASPDEFIQAMTFVIMAVVPA